MIITAITALLYCALYIYTTYIFYPNVFQPKMCVSSLCDIIKGSECTLELVAGVCSSHSGS